LVLIGEEQNVVKQVVKRHGVLGFRGFVPMIPHPLEFAPYRFALHTLRMICPCAF